MKALKRFTWVELLVVVVVLALSTLSLTCITNTAREKSRRIQCANQLHTLARSIYMYECEYKDQCPVVWPSGTEGSFGKGLYNRRNGTEITRWCNPQFQDWAKQPTVGGCLYLLVIYEEADPKDFVCPGAKKDKPMDFNVAKEVARQHGWEVKDWKDLRDFQSLVNLSYSYNDPWSALIDAIAPADLAILADKSWAYDTETGERNEKAGDFPVPNSDGSWNNAQGQNIRHGNSGNHGTDYQNILFADGHVRTCEVPTVGFRNDNIYTYWSGDTDSDQKKIGRWDQGHAKKKREDSYLGN